MQVSSSLYKLCFFGNVGGAQKLELDARCYTAAQTETREIIVSCRDEVLDERIRLAREQARLDGLYKALNEERKENKMQIEAERRLVEESREKRRKVDWLQVSPVALMFM